MKKIVGRFEITPPIRNYPLLRYVQDYDKIPILHNVLVLDPPQAFDGDHSIAFYIPAQVDTARSVIVCKFYAFLNKEQHFQTLYYHKNV